LQIAIIGAGNNAIGHAKSLAVMDEVEIVGIVDPVIERAQSLVDLVGGQAFKHHAAMLRLVAPDAVWVCSPCWLHADQTVDCLSADAHVMCEKPMALNVADCDRMIEAASSRRVKLMVDQTTRFVPNLVEMQRIFRSGECGDLVRSWSIRESYHRIRNDASWRLDFDKSGGIVFEWEVHEIDFVRSIGGRVSEVYAKTAFSREDAPGFLDFFSAILTFENGGYGNLEASQSEALGMSSRGFSGTKGSAISMGKNRIKIQTVDDDEPRIIEVEPDEGSKRGLNRYTSNRPFIEAILTNGPSPVSGEDAKHNIEIAVAIVESGQTGEVVEIGSGESAVGSGKPVIR
jgi:myo-inositol 2-dehydrogenase/D-chiro-inositol 1-dehydrogenase